MDLIKKEAAGCISSESLEGTTSLESRRGHSIIALLKVCSHTVTPLGKWLAVLFPPWKNFRYTTIFLKQKTHLRIKHTDLKKHLKIYFLPKDKKKKIWMFLNITPDRCGSVWWITHVKTFSHQGVQYCDHKGLLTSILFKFMHLNCHALVLYVSMVQLYSIH